MKNNHGGKRQGAGRPSKPRTKKNYSFYLTKEQYEKLVEFLEQIKKPPCSEMALMENRNFNKQNR